MASHIKGFDWDAGNWPKCGKNGVSKEEIETMFENNPGVYPDVAHSRTEDRQLAIGVTHGMRWLLVAFTLRRIKGHIFIRPISARYMHSK